MRPAKVATRRGFLFRATAALSAPLTLAAVAKASTPRHQGTLEARLAALEDANAVRDLQRAYVRAINARAWSSARALFSEPSRAIVDESVGEIALRASDESWLEVAPDRATAVARLPCTVRVETPLDAPGCTLVEMARLQGEGTLRRHERRVLEQAFVRESGGWRIDRSLLREADRSI
jgi:SnoaL-like domain